MEVEILLMSLLELQEMVYQCQYLYFQDFANLSSGLRQNLENIKYWSDGVQIHAGSPA